MELTEDTFDLFAAKYYDNPYCLNKDEFDQDLRLISTIKRMSQWLDSDCTDSIRVRRFVNNVILFFNVFEHHAAAKMLEFKTLDHHWHKINSCLYFLSLPLIGDQQFDIILHRRIAKEFK